MSALTFTFTVLLRRASLAKGYCNICGVSDAPPNAKRRLACSTLPRRLFSDRVRNCSISSFSSRRLSTPDIPSSWNSSDSSRPHAAAM